MNHQCYVKPEKIECPHAHPTFEITQHDRDEKGFTIIRFHLFCTDCRGDFAFRRPSSIVKASENFMDMYVFGEFVSERFPVSKPEPAEKKEYVPTLHDQAIALCAAIERLPASPEQTEVSIQASNLANRIVDVKAAVSDYEAYCQEAPPGHHDQAAILDRCRDKNAALRAEVDTLKKQVAILQEANEVAIGNERAARALSNVVRGERDAMAVKLGETERKLENVTNYSYGCEEQVKHARSERDHALQRLKEANTRALGNPGFHEAFTQWVTQAGHKELLQQLAEKDEAINRLGIQVQRLERELEEMPASRSPVVRRDAVNELHATRLTLEKVRTSRNEIANQAEKLQSQLTQVSQERDAATAAITHVRELNIKIIKDLETQLANVRGQLLQANRTPNELDNRIGRLERNLEEMTAKRDRLQQQLDQIEPFVGEGFTLGTKYEAMQKELGKQKTELEQVRAERDVLKTEFRKINEMAERIL